MLIRHNGGDWHEPVMTAYENEATLQKLLADTPRLLPGAQTGPALVVSELHVLAGYIDMVAISLEGEITLVECKLRANSEIRRHIVGQVFAYASSLWRCSYDQ